eukprot:TRINITY_DN2383_c0_g1_i1.p2 TRINITY_DN2383_c0_g1~~TRINITY_DN2383_c0_g1_i1.p2  ORF type:complete len:261 (+),score=110.77 TRINITY_DN2383_c0_g1_i1:1142-1924(+)
MPPLPQHTTTTTTTSPSSTAPTPMTTSSTPTTLHNTDEEEETEDEEEKEKYVGGTINRLQQLVDSLKDPSSSSPSTSSSSHLHSHSHPHSHSPSSSTTTTTTTSSSQHAQQQHTQQQQQQQHTQQMGDKQEAFEDLFLRCLKAYANVAPELRPSKIRRVMRFSTAQDLEHVSEFVALLSSEGLGRDTMGETEFMMTGGGGSGIGGGGFGSVIGSSMGGMIGEGLMGDGSGVGGVPVCTCAHCPHRIELEKIDEFYSEFLC